MIERAKGTFEVKIAPLPADVNPEISSLGRMSIDKVFSGDLVATGKGQMLTGMTDTKNSAAYVAIEHVSGTLHGKSGTFTLQHRGIMNRGKDELIVSVVPDSGANELKGISGTLKIIIDDNGKHFYEFEYSLN